LIASLAPSTPWEAQASAGVKTTSQADIGRKDNIERAGSGRLHGFPIGDALNLLSDHCPKNVLLAWDNVHRKKSIPAAGLYSVF
jgi:hypothetical protein